MCGATWVCVELLGYVWSYLGMCGATWVCVELLGYVWSYLGMCGAMYVRSDFMQSLVEMNA